MIFYIFSRVSACHNHCMTFCFCDNVGAGLLVYAIVDLVTFIQVKRVAKEIKEEFKNIEPPIVDADAKEVDNDNEIDSNGREV